MPVGKVDLPIRKFNIPTYSLGREDSPNIRTGANKGGRDAFLIRSGISYTFHAAPSSNRDLTTEFATLDIPPFGNMPFSICNFYRRSRK